LGKLIRDHTAFLHKREWNIMMKDLEKNRRLDSAYDAKMALLVYYNDDIDGKEKQRRWLMLDLPIVEKVVDQCNALALAPRPLSWHKARNIAFTDEMWDSVKSGWDDAWEAIEDIPERHAQRVRDEAPRYWKQQREEWRDRLEQEPLSFKAKKEKYGGLTQEQLNVLGPEQERIVVRIRPNLEERILRWKQSMEREKIAVRKKIREAELAHKISTEEWYDLHEDLRRLEQREELVIRQVTRETEIELKHEERTLAFYSECAKWARSHRDMLRRIQLKAKKELDRMNWQQEREYQRLFPDTEEEEVQSEDLSFADILANHLTRSSPADCSSLKGYGDDFDFECTLMEKIGLDGRILLGTRGLEAVQVSSHRASRG
jgi:hypothetical protein